MLPGPINSLFCSRSEPCWLFNSCCCPVMVSGNACHLALPNDLQTFIRIGIVPDEITQTNRLVHLCVINFLQYGSQCLPISMDIGNDGEPHLSFPWIGVFARGPRSRAFEPAANNLRSRDSNPPGMSFK